METQSDTSLQSVNANYLSHLLSITFTVYRFHYLSLSLSIAFTIYCIHYLSIYYLSHSLIAHSVDRLLACLYARLYSMRLPPAGTGMHATLMPAPMPCHANAMPYHANTTPRHANAVANVCRWYLKANYDTKAATDGVQNWTDARAGGYWTCGMHKLPRVPLLKC